MCGTWLTRMIGRSLAVALCVDCSLCLTFRQMSAASVASPRANGDAAPVASAAAVGVAVSPPWFHSSTSALNAPALLALRGASDDQMSGALSAVFRARNEGISVARRDRFMHELGKSADETDALLLALSHLLHAFLYLGCDSKESVFALFPRDFDKELRRALTEKMMQKQPEWRETLLQSAVGPAKLVEFDWRVDVKSSSNHLSNMAVPTVLVDMKLQPPPTSTRLIAPLESFNFELTPAALTTLLNGLEKIQSTLAAMK